MLDIDGYEVCSILKNNPHTKNIHVLFISELSDIPDKIKAFNVGGLDYINKPFQIDEVKACVSTHLKLKAYQDCMEEKLSRVCMKLNCLI